MKTVDFSESIAACDLKFGRCRQLIELMKVFEYSRSRSFIDLGPRSFTYENQNLTFLGNLWAILTKFYIFKDFKYKEAGCHVHIW